MLAPAADWLASRRTVSAAAVRRGSWVTEDAPCGYRSHAPDHERQRGSEDGCAAEGEGGISGVWLSSGGGVSCGRSGGCWTARRAVRAGLLTFVGASGSGKTALAEAAAGEARRRGFEVLRGSPPAGQPGRLVWAQLLRDAGGPDELAAGLLGAEAGPLDLDSAARHLASAGPRLIVVDDVDRGGPEAAAMLSVVAARCAASGTAVIATSATPLGLPAELRLAGLSQADLAEAVLAGSTASRDGSVGAGGSGARAVGGVARPAGGGPVPGARAGRPRRKPGPRRPPGAAGGACHGVPRRGREPGPAARAGGRTGRGRRHPRPGTGPAGRRAARRRRGRAAAAGAGRRGAPAGPADRGPGHAGRGPRRPAARAVGPGRRGNPAGGRVRDHRPGPGGRATTGANATASSGGSWP